ncbi:MAG: formate dehydrogenase subunit gamma [Acidobacteria bacterium]|nr:formate dehydrogenase subunit gamma [Acidobacteriota bacterium]
MKSGRVKLPGQIERYTFSERVVHWIAGGGYVYLLLSGLAFFSSHFYWLASLLGGGLAARVWHPWVGLLFVIAVVWMHHIWRRDMRLTEADRAWSKALWHYIRNEDSNVPPAGRFNTGQKQFFWLMYFGGILLLVSGLILWFTEYVPWNWRAVRSFAVLVHVVVALLTVGGFIVHIYMGTLVVRGGWGAITQGTVSETWARAHHRLWWNEITGDATAKNDSLLLEPTDRTS